jgi:hypothetical protein
MIGFAIGKFDDHILILKGYYNFTETIYIYMKGGVKMS